MRNPRHIALAVTIVAIWGVNFVMIGKALDGYPPLLLAALRFLLTALAAFFVPRPRGVRWYWVAAVGTATFVGQYALLFTALAHGMPDGLASLVLQAQAPFTVLFAAVALRERTGPRQLAGIAVAGAGLAVIGVGRGGDVPLSALLISVAAAASWAVGNICTRQAGAQDGFALMVWASVWAAPPLLALSLAVEGPHQIGHALAHPYVGPVLGLLYVVALSTFVGLGGWLMLLSRYPAGAVAPYTLGVPPVGLLSAWLFVGERANALELAGCAVVLLGLAAIVVNRPLARKPSPAAAIVEEAVSA
jgi:O-acetylserine/cysteine efflux transporter